MAKEGNPLEELTDELADTYVEMVFDLAKEFAPVRPWYHHDLSIDEQLWRWEEIRDPVVEWLMNVGVNLGYQSGDEVLDNLERIFTDETVVDLVPADIVVRIPPELLELVQAVGPKAAAKHIRTMEKKFEGYAQARGVLAAASTFQFPEPPDVPPPLRVETLPDTGFYPLYGLVPQESAPGFQLSV